MTEFISEIFKTLFNGNVVLATVLVSMVPIMELKGGIPFGMSEAFWGAAALGRWEAFGWAFLGCSIVVVFLYFAFVPIMRLLRKTKIFKGLANYIDNRIKNKSAQIQSDNIVEEGINTEKPTTKTKKSTAYKMLGVFIFTAIPLPLTGVWMGTCLAVMLGLNFWQTMASVQLGNLLAGVIISTICVMFPQFTHWLIYIFLILVICVIICEIIKNKINKKIKNKQK